MGDLYESLRRLARSLESGRHIVLLKSMSNPMPVLKRCDFFILSSFCDVNGARSFLKEYGGTLLPDSEEGVLQGMEMYASGKIHPLHVDYETRNQQIIQKCEKLFQE